MFDCFRIAILSCTLWWMMLSIARSLGAHCHGSAHFGRIQKANRCTRRCEMQKTRIQSPPDLVLHSIVEMTSPHACFALHGHDRSDHVPTLLTRDRHTTLLFLTLFLHHHQSIEFRFVLMLLALLFSRHNKECVRLAILC